MSLFSSKPKNRRRRRLTKKSPMDAWASPELKATQPKKRAKSDDLVGRVYELNAQIGALENFLAKKTAARSYQEQMKREGILPPPDRLTPQRSRKKAALSHAERRRYHAERSKSGLHFFILFALACALIWWLIDSGI